MNSTLLIHIADAFEAVGAFIQTVLGEGAAVKSKKPEDCGSGDVQVEALSRLIFTGFAQERAVFSVALDEAAFNAFSQTMLGEVLRIGSDEGADLARELAAQAYGAVRAQLSAGGLKIPDVTFRITGIGEVTPDLPEALWRIPFAMTLGAETFQGAAFTPVVEFPEAAPPPPAQAPARPSGGDGAPRGAAQRGAPTSAAPALFPELGSETKRGPIEASTFELLAEVELEVTVELGRRRLPLADVLRLTMGSVIELDKLVGEPLEIYANNRLIAEGEAVVIDEQFGIRITSLVSKKMHERTIHY